MRRFSSHQPLLLHVAGLAVVASMAAVFTVGSQEVVGAAEAGAEAVGVGAVPLWVLAWV
jgi:hypothetical protein